MAKIVPQKNSFELAGKYDRWKIACTYITASLSFLTGLLQGISMPKENLQMLSGFWLPGLTLIATVMTIILHVRFDSEYHRAETIRRDAFFDNAFGCLIADTKSEEYFSNESTPNGIRKGLLNVAENCFFSLPVVNHMYMIRLRVAIPIGVALITVMIFNAGGSQFVMLAFNLVISLAIFDDLLQVFRLKRELEIVHQKCKEILSYTQGSSNGNESFQFIGETFREIVRYETALSYASIMLDSKYFHKINSEKSQEWELYKKRYGAQ